MTGLDVTAYRTAAGDALRAAQSVQRELSSLDPDGAIEGIDWSRRLNRLMPPREGMTAAEYHRYMARRSIHMACAHMLQARLADQEAGQ